MKILAIETSCDETAISLVNVTGGNSNPAFSVLGNVVLSQAAKHAEFGGVFPSLAKREHAEHITSVLEQVLKQSGHLTISANSLLKDDAGKMREMHSALEREPELEKKLVDFITTHKKPDIDHIVVTAGPGLEPALWIGINFAQVLNIAWGIPLWPVNHMEGHILSVLAPNQDGNQITLSDIQFPALSLLISGGHTELVLMRDWFEYDVIGKTRDDAVGEAFDKTARLLGLPYPGGPEISHLAEQATTTSPDAGEVPRDEAEGYKKNTPQDINTPQSRYIGEQEIKLPRPMIHTDDYDFSFSGIKTAVRYMVQELEASKTLKENKANIAREFQNAVTDVLVKKTMRAIDEFGCKTLIIGGGVSANKHIRNEFETITKNSGVKLLIPEFNLSTDNSLMIAIAGYFQIMRNKKSPDIIRAQGNLGF
ncbi:MAG: tRNA (adenosine(37)-N6)-threonylcarbamoyltransferase complex transferase subunit TsaD [Candidatus Nomurabacteria bacterium]|nr:tRNA (adenosine(37)-N6)-threonylcarbamoyltransferase complex transferase subunit TsaD [Candidatus Nomurabacteria bacterium]